MTDSSPSPYSTPKRKRSSLPTYDDGASPPNAQFLFDVNLAGSVPASGSSSPRTNIVAHRFRGLALGDHHDSSGGGGVGVAFAPASADNDTAGLNNADAAEKMQVDEDESKMRKRSRTSPMPDTFASTSSSTLSSAAPQTSAPRHRQAEISETPDAQQRQPDAAADPISRAPARSAPTDVAQSEPPKPNIAASFVVDQALFTSSPKPSPARLSRPFPAASNRALEALRATSRGRKRAGTPPLTGTTKAGSSTDQQGLSADGFAIGGGSDPIDPVRAALTWHEDEITIYDPEDEDDDGVGINGIGFKPTPAIAYARTMKRRQQLAEYKKREEREARARRSLRRRGGSPTPELPRPKRTAAGLQREDSAGRKVRFTESESSVMIETV